MQCCRDHKECATRGHVQCLEKLTREGRFLPFDSPDRKAAGEARRLQAWEAAVAACEAGHDRVLKLILKGWRPTIDNDVPWHLCDFLPTLTEEERDFSRANRLPGLPASIPEFRLCRAVVNAPSFACFRRLLSAGCRSPWLCILAAGTDKMKRFNAANRSRMHGQRSCPLPSSQHKEHDSFEGRVCRSPPTGT